MCEYNKSAIVQRIHSKCECRRFHHDTDAASICWKQATDFHSILLVPRCASCTLYLGAIPLSKKSISSRTQHVQLRQPLLCAACVKGQLWTELSTWEEKLENTTVPVDLCMFSGLWSEESTVINRNITSDLYKQIQIY